MKIFGRVVGCGTGLTRFDEDRGVPLEGVRGFYGKIHLGEPICVTGQGVAYVARYPTASVGFWRRTISAGVGKRVIANRASWTGD